MVWSLLTLHSETGPEPSPLGGQLVDLLNGEIQPSLEITDPVQIPRSLGEGKGAVVLECFGEGVEPTPERAGLEHLLPGLPPVAENCRDLPRRDHLTVNRANCQIVKANV